MSDLKRRIHLSRRRLADAQSPPRRAVYGVTVGGSAFVLLRGQLAWLKSRGWDVHLVTSGDDMATRAAQREDVPLHSIRMCRDISVLRDVLALIAWIRLLRSLRPQIVNVGTPKASLIGGLAAWICRIPRRVYVVRGLRLEGTSGALQTVLWVMEWLTIRLATDVIVVSSSLARELHRRKLITPRRVWLIGRGSSNGVPFEQVARSAAAPSRQTLRQTLGLSPHHFVVGYVGRISADKGVDVLVNALRRLEGHANIRLLMIGSIDGARGREWLSALDGRVVQIDWTDNVWAYYAAMDVLCLPTKREGFPNVVLEAGAASLPTITTNATGAIDSVIDGVTGLIVPVNDDIALSRAIAELASQPSRVQKMGINASRHVHHHYDPEHIWLGIESVLLGDPEQHVREI